MPNIFGASLGEILRHGSQFGLGVQDAGRQNAKQQYDVDKARREEIQQALIDQARISQSEASAERDRAYTTSLSNKPPEPYSETQVRGLMREFGPTGKIDPAEVLRKYREKHGQRTPEGFDAEALADIQRERAIEDRSAASASRAGSGERSRGEVVADARGYAETLALQLTKNPSVKSDPTLRAQAEGFAVEGLRGRYPQVGADEAIGMVRREFRNILDEAGSSINLTGAAAEAFAKNYGNSPADTIP